MEAPEQAESDDVAVSEQAEKEETAAPKQVEKEETAVPEQAEKEETGTAKAAEQAIPDQNDAGRSGAADSSVDTDTAANGEREEDSADVEEENPEEDEDSGTVRRSGVLRAPRRAPQAAGWERMLETGPQFAADVAVLTARPPWTWDCGMCMRIPAAMCTVTAAGRRPSASRMVR